MGRDRVKLVLTADPIAPSQQLIDQVERLVALGVCRPGDALPGASTLADDLGISRVTVQRAYDTLVRRGVAEARVGVGTFIASTADTRADYIRRYFSSTITLAEHLHLNRTEVSNAFEHELSRHFLQRRESSPSDAGGAATDVSDDG
ncbi:MAG: hypothetical protein NVS1B2_27250 [Vulcanimicrobiaceae bacterium]